MAQLIATNTSMTHKSGPKKRVAIRQRVVSNGKRYNLRQLAARRTLTPRQNERLYTNRNRVGDRGVYSQSNAQSYNAKEAYRRSMFRASSGGIRYLPAAGEEDRI